MCCVYVYIYNLLSGIQKKKSQHQTCNVLSAKDHVQPCHDDLNGLSRSDGPSRINLSYFESSIRLYLDHLGSICNKTLETTL